MPKHQFSVYTPDAETTRLRLVEEGGEVTLCVVDNDGDTLSEVLKITNEGKCYFHDYVCENLGLSLNKHREINIVGYSGKVNEDGDSDDDCEDDDE